MGEICKNCRNRFGSGIWMASQFKDEKVLFFCSDKCKNKYIKMKLARIKVNYPKYR
jgi:ribosomal protein L24E